MASIKKNASNKKQYINDRRIDQPLKKPKKGSYDHIFLLVFILLIGIGTIMVFSASAPWSGYKYDDPYYYITKQILWLLVGGAAMFVTSIIPYKFWQKMAVPILLVCIVLLILVLIPGIGKVVKGSRRWFKIISFQPSELAKIGFIIFFAASLSIAGDNIKKWLGKRGLLFHLAIIGVIALLLILEPHFSATVVICLTLVAMIFFAGGKIRDFIIIGIPALLGGAALIILEPYRLVRFFAFLDPFADASDNGYQAVNSLYAIGSGGFFGAGMGMSKQKYSYIPEPQNDFIFAILCEEFGFFGATIVILLFALLIWRGFMIASKSKDKFAGLMVAGIMTIIAIQVVINIGVVTSSLPVTGMQLPFFSYGGSSLAVYMAAMGIILNVSKYNEN